MLTLSLAALVVLSLVGSSVLGAVASTTRPHPQTVHFDPTTATAPLSAIGQVGTKGAMDAVLNSGRLYYLSFEDGGSLVVADVSDPRSPMVLGRFGGMGNVRQLAIDSRGVAYVTAREEGLFLIDVNRPDRPTLLSRFDTIELATGIAVDGPVAFVACRFSGVQLVDVTDPRAPAHLSTVRVGEAQSVISRDGYLYVGVWQTLELAIVDIRNPRQPRVVSKTPLDGYGDGVDVRGDLCFVATGHHSADAPSMHPPREHPSYGAGHGLEIFDISDRANPRLIRRLKAPALYGLSIDTWRVQIGGKHAYLADTYNGVFVIDISIPAEARFVARHVLPEVTPRGQLPRNASGMTPGPVAGLAVGEGVIYVAGAWTALHLLDAGPLASPIASPATRPAPATPIIPPPSTPRSIPGVLDVFSPPGQVHAVKLWESHPDGSATCLVAAGSAGIHVVRVGETLVPERAVATDGFAFAIDRAGDFVVVAEGQGGLTVRRFDSLEVVGRYRSESRAIKQVLVEPSGRYAMLQVGWGQLQIVDLSDPTDPKLVLRDEQPGLFYQRPLSPSTHNGAGTANWHISGIFEYDLTDPSGPRRASAVKLPIGAGAQSGAAPYQDGWVIAYAGRISLATRRDDGTYAHSGPFDLPARAPRGKPVVFGHTLYLSDAIAGLVTALDISDFERPRLLATLRLTEHPGYVVEHRGRTLVPGGYQGLLLWQHSAPRP